MNLKEKMRRRCFVTGWKFVISLSVFLLSFCSAFGFSGSGDGAQMAPYVITSASQLDEIRNDLSAHYVLGNDINLGVAPWNVGNGWLPIGSISNGFSGSLDGDGKSISGLAIKANDGYGEPFSDYVGLFACVNSDGSVKNLSISGKLSVFFDGDPKRNIGLLVGQNEGSISGVNATSTIQIEYQIKAGMYTIYRLGGVVGKNSGSINDCFSDTSLFCLSPGEDGNVWMEKLIGVGGFVGENNESGEITSSSVRVYFNIVHGYPVNIGGFVGRDYGVISKCSAQGTIRLTSPAGLLVGGFAGWCLGQIDNSDATVDLFINRSVSEPNWSGMGRLSGYGGFVGGVSDGSSIFNSHYRGTLSMRGGEGVGGFFGGCDAFGYFSGCSANAQIISEIRTNGYSGGSQAGGFGGQADGVTIQRCSSMGSVNGISTVGAFIGQISNSTINDSYSHAAITSGSIGGGFVGNASDTSFVNCYNSNEIFGSTKSFISTSVGNSFGSSYWNSSLHTNGDNIGVFPLRSDELSNPINLIGWNFDSIWAMRGHLPILQRMGELGDVVIRSFTSSFVSEDEYVQFLEGVNTGTHEFLMDVDWEGHSEGTIRFYKNDQLIQSGSSESYTLDVADWSVGDRLSVEAVAVDGTRSDRMYANFEIIPSPFGLAPSAVVPSVQNGQLSYEISGVALFSSTEGVDRVDAEIEGDEGEEAPFPLFDGKPCKYNSYATVDFVIQNGYGRVSDVEFGGFGVKLGDFELSLEIEEDVRIWYDTSEKKWVYTGESEALLAVDFPGIEIVTPFEGLLELEVGVSAEVGERREYTDWSSGHGWETEGTLLAGLGGKFTAGLGEDDLGYGIFVWLKLMGRMELMFASDPVLQRIGLEFSCGDKEVLGPYIWEHVWYSHEFPIVDNRAHSDPLAMMSELELPADAVRQSSVDKSEFTLLPRTAVLSRTVSLKSVDGALPLQSGDALMMESGLVNEPIAMAMSAPSPIFPQTNVFSYTQTAFSTSESNACYLWNVDDPARSSENRTVLKFSFDDGAAWSSPATLWEDGTGDYNPSVQVLDDGSAFAVWANGKSALVEGAGPDEMLETLEVAFGRYMPGSGWSCTNLTDNAVLDQSPKISVAEDGSAWVVWVRNEANNHQGSTNEPNTLMARYFDGASWSAEQAVATNLNIIASGGLVQVGGQTIYTCSMHNDDNYFSVDDTEIYQAVCSNGTWGGLDRLTDNGVRDISVQLKATTDGSPVAAWVQGDELRLSRNSDFSASQSVMSTTNEPMAAYFDLLCGASNQIGMVWCSGSDDGQDAFMINFDPVLSMWSEPIQLTADLLAERAFKGNYDEADGTLNLAFVRSEILNPTNAAPQYGVTDVCLIDFNSGVDLRVVDFRYDFAQMVPGSNVVLSAVVDNAGLSGATNVVLAIYDGDPAGSGLLVGQTNISLFGAGAVISFDQTWLVPSDGAMHPLYITADYAQALDDQNRGNNSLQQDMLTGEVTLDSFFVENLTHQAWTFNALLANDSYCAYSNSVTVDFYRPDDSGEMIHRVIQDVMIPVGSNLLVSTDWIDSGLLTNSTETLSALLYCGSDTSVVSAVLTRFETPIDTDLDFISDAEELRFGTDPNLLDTDGDGLDDRFELLQFESSALLADTDGDGYDDYHEYIAGTSSTNPFSLFVINWQNGRIRCPTISNRTYSLEFTDDLTGTWHVLTNFSGTGGFVDLENSVDTNTCFFRMKVTKP